MAAGVGCFISAYIHIFIGLFKNKVCEYCRQTVLRKREGESEQESREEREGESERASV